MMDRLISGARGLVRVKPAGDSAAAEPVGDDPWTVRSRMAQRLSRGAYDEALAEWEKLDAAAKEATTASAMCCAPASPPIARSTPRGQRP